MIDTLNSIYLRLDVNMQYLASKAIAQIIVKIVYSNSDGSMTVGEIKKELAKLNEGNRFDDAEIDAIITDLEDKELRQRNGRYYLSTSRRDKIRKSLEESEERQNAILNKYFSGLNSGRDVLKKWLSVITQTFFETYSNEWISDLNAHTNHILQSADSIRLQVTRRTESIKDIDKDDKKELPGRFFNFVNSRDTDVDDFLWGYGTSSFASKLIRNKYGVDKLTMETFKDSVCILDTNVLLFIALKSKYTESFKALEKVFMDLNVQPKFLYITQKEFENKVQSQREMTLSNFDKFGYETISKLEDDFTMSAKRLYCKLREDFERFFDVTLTLPSSFNLRLPITLMDCDTKMVEVIEKAQNDETLKDELNAMYKSVVGRDKSPSACRHDIGLLEGVRYLRDMDDETQNKVFIISDEISVNQYSKSKGTKHNLPLSLRVDTLINMLAVNNGGGTFDASDYKPLFANIIRLGLTPRKDTFNQEELYQLSQMNDRISNLPPELVCDIAWQMHKKRLSGESDSDLRRELNVLVTRGEIQVKDEISDMKGQLNVQGREKQRLNDELQIARNAVRKQVEVEYDKGTRRQVTWWWIGIVAFVIVLAVVSLYVIYHNQQEGSMLSAYVISVVSGLFVSAGGGLFAQRKVLNIRRKKRENSITEEVNHRLNMNP